MFIVYARLFRATPGACHNVASQMCLVSWRSRWCIVFVHCVHCLFCCLCLLFVLAVCACCLCLLFVLAVWACCLCLLFVGLLAEPGVCHRVVAVCACQLGLCMQSQLQLLARLDKWRRKHCKVAVCVCCADVKFDCEKANCEIVNCVGMRVRPSPMTA